MIVRRQTKAGKIRYGVKIDRPGRRQEWIGTFDTIAEARKAEAKARLERPTSAMTCDAWVEHWLDGYRARVKDSAMGVSRSCRISVIPNSTRIPKPAWRHRERAEAGL